VDEDRDGTGVKNRLERAADVNGEQEHHVHHQQEDRQTEEAVEHNLIHRRRKAAGFAVRALLTTSQIEAMAW
jgi:hypothetical protein